MPDLRTAWEVLAAFGVLFFGTYGLHLLAVRYFDPVHQAKRAVEREQKRWWKQYNRYLRSREWKRRREGILLRSQGRCEICGRPGPVQCHHLTYARVFHELPEDLAALCFSCHRAQHGRRS